MEERIDNYITGKMTPEEILQFRKDLNTDMHLREEYEKAKEIADAIQKNALKQKLKQEESKRRGGRFNWQTLVYYLAAAASLALFVMSGTSYVVSNNLKGTSAGLYGDLEAPVSRSANVVDELLEGAYENIGVGDLSTASQKLDAVDNAIKDQMDEEYDNAELNEYYHSILMVQQQEAEWYRAIILMRKGKVSKSKAALQKIVAADGIYAPKAQELLNSKFNL